MLPIEQLNTMSETSRNATRHLTEVALEGQEKMVRLNIDAMQEFIKVGGEQIKETCSDLALANPAEAWPHVIMSHIQRGTALNLSFIEMTKRVQQEMACLVEENLRALRDETLEAVDQYASAVKSNLHKAGRRDAHQRQAA